MVDQLLEPLLVPVGPEDRSILKLEASGVLTTIREQNSPAWISRSQLGRVVPLSEYPFDWNVGPQLPDSLFAPPVVLALGQWTCLVDASNTRRSGCEELWLQLLPLWIDAGRKVPNDVGSTWREVNAGRFRAYTMLNSVSENFRSSRAMHQRLAANRSAYFARSASYMGSKSALAGQLMDIVDALQTRNCTMIDLMCGSGAMSGAFARRYRTIASDAQRFCRLLGLVQGGGMRLERATGIAEQVMSIARTHYRRLPETLRSRIASEDRLLNSELTDALRASLISDLQWRAKEWEIGELGRHDHVAKAWQTGSLISHLYGGLYFGDRQAAELDCLRRAVNGLENQLDRQWALGALVCAASSCAFTYGGHFAQPKLDVGPDGPRRGSLEDAIRQRTLSVTHEFYVRLTSLAEESEQCENKVELIDGPWETAVAEASKLCADQQVCVYIDPPYTRDEYSRYYHVLEALVNYQPQAVTGKGRLPARNTAGRFASTLSGRRPERIEREIAKVLESCLRLGWNCLWSYSDSGTASIPATLSHLGAVAKAVEVFHMEHSYKAQGKKGPKHVREYAVHLQAKK